MRESTEHADDVGLPPWTLPERTLSVSVIVPALNEQQHLDAVITRTRDLLSRGSLDWEIIIVNDGSTDDTGTIANRWASIDPRIKALHHERPGGIGCAFRKGVEGSTKEAVTWVPGDGQNDAREVVKYLPLLQHVDIVLPFVLNTGVRSLWRRLLSTVYLWIINLSFGVVFTYTNGTGLYRRALFDVVQLESNGFFFSTECLIKAVRAGFIFAEVPVNVRDRVAGRSKAISLRSLWSVSCDFIKLFVAMHVLRRSGRLQPRPESRPDSRA